MLGPYSKHIIERRSNVGGALELVVEEGLEAILHLCGRIPHHQGTCILQSKVLGVDHSLDGGFDAIRGVCKAYISSISMKVVPLGVLAKTLGHGDVDEENIDELKHSRWYGSPCIALSPYDPCPLFGVPHGQAEADASLVHVQGDDLVELLLEVVHCGVENGLWTDTRLECSPYCAVDEIDDEVIQKIDPCHRRTHQDEHAHDSRHPERGRHDVHARFGHGKLEGLVEDGSSDDCRNERIHGIFSKHLDAIEEGDGHGGPWESLECMCDDGDGPEKVLVGSLQAIEEGPQRKGIGSTAMVCMHMVVFMVC